MDFEKFSQFFSKCMNGDIAPLNCHTVIIQSRGNLSVFADQLNPLMYDENVNGL